MAIFRMAGVLTHAIAPAAILRNLTRRGSFAIDFSLSSAILFWGGGKGQSFFLIRNFVVTIEVVTRRFWRLDRKMYKLVK